MAFLVNTTTVVDSSRNVTAVAFFYSSDRTKKENIITIDNALDKIEKLRGVYYNRIDDETKTRRLGVVAQEVQEVFPEVVIEGEDGLMVSYGNMVGVLIQAIKEQQKQIAELTQEVNSLKSNQ
jgi:transketolase C-terminal domain/subunit